MSGTAGARVNVVAWSQALDCADTDELAAVLDRACGRADAISADVAGLQSFLAGLVSAGEQDLHELLLRLGVMAEGVWLVLDHARRAARSTVTERTSLSAPGGVR